MAPTINVRKRTRQSKGYNLRKRPTTSMRSDGRQLKRAMQLDMESVRKQPASTVCFSVLNEKHTEASKEVHKPVFDRITITEQNQVASPLLRLPGELRNKIYRLVGETITFGHRAHDFSIYGEREFSLLLTCRQINYEASSLLPVHQILRLGWGFDKYDLRELYAKNHGRAKPSIWATHELRIHYTFFGILGFVPDFDPDRDSESCKSKPELLAMFPELQRIEAHGTPGKNLPPVGLVWLKDLCCGDYSGVEMVFN